MNVTNVGGTIECNENLLIVIGGKWCGYGMFSLADEVKYFNMKCANEDIGVTMKDVLSGNVHLPYSKEAIDLLLNDEKKYHKEELRFLQKKYGYKTKTAVYRNMHSCSLALDNAELTISPMYRKGTGAWNGLDERYNIVIQLDTPPELLGACARYAFTRCKGNGVNVVTKALFPDEAPNSLEEYLESIDKDYKRWLISC
jgi:hypothetical protein